MAQGSPAVWITEIQDRFTQRFGWSEDEVVRWLAERGYCPSTVRRGAQQPLTITTLDAARLGNDRLLRRACVVRMNCASDFA